MGYPYFKYIEDESNTELLHLDEIDSKRSKLSNKAWAVLFFIGYLIIGLLFYCYSSSYLSALDAVYFSIITFTTIGYGDVEVINRPFTTFYVLLGAGMIGTILGIATGDVVDHQEESLKNQFLKAANSMTVALANTAKKLRKYQSQNPSILSSRSNDNNSTIAKSIATESLIKMKDMNMAIFDQELREIRMKGIVDAMFVLVAIFSGAVAMSLIEQWSFTDSIYWACVTITSVGYGDVVPTTQSGKIFTIFYAVVGCSLAAKGFHDLVYYPLTLRAKENELIITRQFGDELSEKTLNRIIRDELFFRIPNLRKSSKEMNKSEFVLLLMHLMGKIQDKDILLASKIFDKLDVECDGVLSERNIEDTLISARKRDKEKAIERHQQYLEQQVQRERRAHTLTGKLSNAASGAVNTTATVLNRVGDQLFAVISSNPLSSGNSNRPGGLLDLDDEENATHFAETNDENFEDDLLQEVHQGDSSRIQITNNSVMNPILVRELRDRIPNPSNPSYPSFPSPEMKNDIVITGDANAMMTSEDEALQYLQRKKQQKRSVSWGEDVSSSIADNSIIAPTTNADSEDSSDEVNSSTSSSDGSPNVLNTKHNS